MCSEERILEQALIDIHDAISEYQSTGKTITSRSNASQFEHAMNLALQIKVKCALAFIDVDKDIMVERERAATKG